ncbi:MAG: FecR domain-containing protein [Candidatus Polarisedimenticolia bacterium]
MSEHPPRRDWIEALLRSTGPRPSIPPESTERVRSAVQAHWRATVHRSRRRVLWAGAGVAAGIGAVAMGLALWRTPPPAPPAVTAGAGHVERVIATVWRKASATEEGPGHLVRAGDELAVGSAILTEQRGRVAIQALSGHSLRLDTGTRLRVLTPTSYALESGAVYVDSGSAPRGGQGIQIHTAAGVVHEIGTQFEVRLSGEALRVRVREGEVRFGDPERGERIQAGQEMEMGAGGLPLTHELPDTAGAWAWIDEVTPMMRIEGRTLRSFLDWVSRERGQRLRFSNTDAETAAGRIRLQGTIDGLTLDQALESVLLTCGMRHHIEGKTLIVSQGI